jgi:hypothetical protein
VKDSKVDVEDLVDESDLQKKAQRDKIYGLVLHIGSPMLIHFVPRLLLT